MILIKNIIKINKTKKMNQNKDIHNIFGFYLDESTKNEEDLLAFSSQYKTSIYKEECFKENEIEQRNIRKRLSGDSTSISQEYSTMSGCKLKNQMTLPKMTEISHRSIGFGESSKKYIDFQEKKRKMSSPLCCYYDGSDIYLSKAQKIIIDMNNSPNYIKKDKFFNNNIEKINNETMNYNNNSFNDIQNLNINLLCQNQNIPLLNKHTKENSNIQNNKEIKRLSFNINQIPFNNIINNMNVIQNNNNNINNNFFFQNNNYNQQVFNLNYINYNNFQNIQINNNMSERKLSHNIEDGIIGNYFNNILNANNYQNQGKDIFKISQTQTKLNPMLFSYSEEQDKKLTKYETHRKSSNNSISNNIKNEKKPFDKRKGDWLCPECHNLNFAFRIVCNRCKIPKPKNLILQKEK